MFPKWELNNCEWTEYALSRQITLHGPITGVSIIGIQKAEGENLCIFCTFSDNLENQAMRQRGSEIIGSRSESAHPPLRRSPKEILYLMRFTCIPPICKHTHVDKQLHNARDAPYVAGFLLEDLGLVLSTVEWRHAREDSRAHVMGVSLDEKTRLSSLSRVVTLCSHAAEVLRILKVLTLSHQLQDTDVTSLGEYFQYMQSESEQSKHIQSASLTASLFFHRTVRSSARRRRFSVRKTRRACDSVCTCSD